MTRLFQLGGLLFFLNTACAVIVHEAVQRDVDGNFTPDPKTTSQDTDGDASRICPPNKIQHEDCRVTPCKVTCEDPKDSKH
jgi:hypothetical protein